jgi:cell division protein FtsB
VRWWILVLLLVLAGLQYRFWYGQGGWYEAASVQKQIEEQRDLNQRLKSRNDVVEAEVLDLKTGSNAVEAKARADHGMARPGETYYLVVDPQPKSSQKTPAKP